MSLVFQKDKNVLVIIGKHKGLTGIIISVIKILNKI
jgi:hypothetical protein